MKQIPSGSNIPIWYLLEGHVLILFNDAMIETDANPFIASQSFPYHVLMVYCLVVGSVRKNKLHKCFFGITHNQQLMKTLFPCMGEGHEAIQN